MRAPLRNAVAPGETPGGLDSNSGKSLCVVRHGGVHNDATKTSPFLLSHVMKKMYVAYVAYERDAEGVPLYVEIPESDVTKDLADSEDREEFFEDMRYEGAVAARVVETVSGAVLERSYEPNPELSEVYMVTSWAYDGQLPYAVTVAELRRMYPMDAFVEFGDELGMVERGAVTLIGLRVRVYRERVAGRTVEVPVVEFGKPVPEDGTYVYVSSRRRVLRRDPGPGELGQPFGRLRVCEQSRDVIPYVDGKPLWSSEIIDWFVLGLGESGAIDAAREAVARARGVWYDGREHYLRLVG